jgi:hypothetical protein
LTCGNRAWTVKHLFHPLVDRFGHPADIRSRIFTPQHVSSPAAVADGTWGTDRLGDSIDHPHVLGEPGNKTRFIRTEASAIASI